jgi:hypothetical protein
MLVRIKTRTEDPNGLKLSTAIYNVWDWDKSPKSRHAVLAWDMPICMISEFACSIRKTMHLLGHM